MSNLQLRWRRETVKVRRTWSRWRVVFSVDDRNMLATVSPFRVVIDGNERMDWYGWLDRYPGGRKSITVKGYSRPEDAMRACEADMLGGLDDERRREAVRQQWLRTAMSAHERMQLRAAWQREDAAGKAA